MAYLRQSFLLILQQSRCFACYSHRMYSSVLYLTGDKAKDTFSVITPYIDAEDRFNKISSLKQNIELRGMDINVESVQSLWEMLSKIEADKKTLERKRKEIANRMKELKGDSDDDVKESKKLKVQGKLLRDDLKSTTKIVWELEKKVVPKILSLPNDLNSRTPNTDVKVISEFKEEPAKQDIMNHIKIGEKLNVLDYTCPEFYYLKGEAAIFELSFLNYFADRLCDHNFVKFCNSDFSRSVIVEGCGIDHENPKETFILEDTGDIFHSKDINRLHLVGGASLVSFCAFFTKQIIPESALPLRLVTMGRQYKPENQNLEHSLFNACQSSSVELFICNADNSDEVMKEFDKCVEIVTEIYTEIGYPFRVVYLPAKQLELHESLRVSFQMYSTYSQSYIEIGNVSLCDDFISKRLLMRYEGRGDMKFTHIISGTALSMPKFLGCVLEMHHNVSDFSSIPLPKEIKTSFKCDADSIE